MAVFISVAVLSVPVLGADLFTELAKELRKNDRYKEVGLELQEIRSQDAATRIRVFENVLRESFLEPLRFGGRLLEFTLFFQAEAWERDPLLRNDFAVAYWKITGEPLPRKGRLLDRLAQLLAASAASENTPTESYLRRGPAFRIPFSQNVTEYLEGQVQKSKKRLETETRASRLNSWNLFLGDLHHWLGHIAEDQDDLMLALLLFEESLEHYRRSGTKRSPRINGLNGAAHAEDHLRKLGLGKKIRDNLFASSGRCSDYLDDLREALR